LIYLANEGGKSERLTATSLGRLLADHRSLRLVVLNACEGARGSDRDLFSSTAAILVRRGLPAVLAMQYEITDRAAIEFSRAFYEVLAEGMAVDTAVVEARKAVSFAVTNTIEWGTPVLYMRAPDGQIFNLHSLAKKKTAPSPPPEPSKLPSPPPPEEPEEERLYKRYKTEGDSLLDQQKYVEAKLKYANALAQRPEDDYLDQRINLCNQKIAEQKAAAEQIKLYVKHKDEGDKLFEQGEYEKAKRSYEQALSHKPGDSYVTKRIQACAKLLVPQTPEGMVLIPAGTFTMGSNDYDNEKPPHKVSIAAFYFDKYEVTVGQYQKFLAANPSYNQPENWNEQLQNPKRPVVNVSWNDAVAYCEWLSKQRGKRVRLPTEAEWEYAARGGLSGKKYPWGDNISAANANYDAESNRGYSWEDAKRYLREVGSYSANNYGLYNMAGNVWEWCSDWYSADYYRTCAQQGVVTNPQGPDKGASRVLRGGSWVNIAIILRCAFRVSNEPASRGCDIGFRCSQDVR